MSHSTRIRNRHRVDTASFFWLNIVFTYFQIFSITTTSSQAPTTEETYTSFPSNKQVPAMAKSTRSKVKRTFRAKKRKEGAFAVADAARLQRLNAKLRALTNSAVAKEGEEEEGEKEQQDGDLPGSSWFAAFGLLNHQDINPILMQSLGFFPSRSSAYSPHPMSSFTHSYSSPPSTFSSIR